MEQALDGGKGPVAAFGVQQAHKAHMLAALGAKRTVLAVAGSDTQAARLYEDVASFGVNAALFLPRETPLVHVVAVSDERRNARVSALARLSAGEACVVVCSMHAVLQRLCPPEAFAETILTVRTGDEFAPRALLALLVQAGYERVELVEGRGQAAARGDILDVFPPDFAHPVRIEFFGDEIDQMRSFDEETQRSIEQLDTIRIFPALETPQSPDTMARGLAAVRGAEGFAEQEAAWTAGLATPAADALLPALFHRLASVLDYLPQHAIIALDDPHRVEEAGQSAELIFSETVKAMLERGEGLPLQAGLMQGAAEGFSSLATARALCLYTLSRPHPAFNPRCVASFDARPAPQYLGNMAELARDVGFYRSNGESLVLYAGERAGILRDALNAEEQEAVTMDRLARAPLPGEVLIVKETLARGFAYPELGLVVLTENELFGKSDAIRRPTKHRGTLHFSELSVGDYIVHEVHGIGRFVGTEPLTVDGSTRDYLLIEYRGSDRLYIPTDQLDRIQKYIGGGGDEDAMPQLSKLGGADWQNRVSRVRASAKKLAFDLARLYAERSAEKGFAFPPDTAWQRQFEDSFPYSETPDQLSSIAEIKKDMESSRPMDRLLCGDVGYGKTEVALRAAFKAIQSGKQVAFLVPTTILAEQHYATATARFSEFPVRVACLSRFRTNAEKAVIKREIRQGRVDLVVGTHALLARDVHFSDLGLLIIDEEHRFGVNHKEQIKNLKRAVDVLTLSATPIPRTLNMSMTGIRDISVIETPPEERFPVQTFVLEYTDALLSDAISRELARGGQAYVVYNRVETMDSFAERLSKLLPEARIISAHGQMPENMLEKAMLAFYNHDADVLLCSTIIESGLDIPNVNTLVVLDADRMGLAQLYQLRGRVGRSTRLGYAYFTIRRNQVLSEKASKRLLAIREFTKFGAGFQLAMRDLEIRGAGSLLGAEQHGHIADIGYEYYCKLMNAAVREARGEQPLPDVDTTIDIPIDAHIPPEYIGNEVQRLYAYRRIADIRSEADVLDVREELLDRYGELPPPVENLFLCALVKSLGQQAGLSTVTVREGSAKLIYGESAAIDGGKLLAALSAQQGARLLATAPPGIVMQLPKADAAEVAKRLLPFLAAISACAD